MKNFTTFNTNAACNRADNSSLFVPCNKPNGVDIENPKAAFFLKLLQALNSKELIEFKGLQDEDAEAFLDQFNDYENIWNSKTLLRKAKEKLKMRAELWCKAYEEKFETFSDFKTHFIKKYVKENDEVIVCEEFWKLIFEGPREKDIMSYVYKLKIYSSKDNIRFVRTKRKLIEIASEDYIRNEMKKCNDWDSFLEICEIYEECLNNQITDVIPNTDH